MLVEPAITWLLVNTSPVAVSSIPVPAAWPPPASVVVMSTTPRDASAAAGPEFPGEDGDAGVVGFGVGLLGVSGRLGLLGFAGVVGRVNGWSTAAGRNPLCWRAPKAAPTAAPSRATARQLATNMTLRFAFLAGGSGSGTDQAQGGGGLDAAGSSAMGVNRRPGAAAGAQTRSASTRSDHPDSNGRALSDCVVIRCVGSTRGPLLRRG